MKPLVTIAVPTLNRLRYLKEAVGSALSQTYPNVEVLVSDDGGTEAVRSWCETTGAGEPRFRYRRNARRLGLAGNWNAAADAARGEFICIIGDDDRLLPDFVSTLVEAAGQSARVTFSNHYIIGERGERLAAESERCTRQYGRHLIPAGEVENAGAVVWGNSVPMSASLLRTADVRRLRFKEELNTPEIELFVRMAEEGARFVFVPEYLAEYRSHSGSATSAGHRSERLAERLLEIPVAPGVEKYKRQFMAPLMVNAVSRCLQQGQRDEARKFLGSEYYPRGEAANLKVGVSTLVQGVCATLPAQVGCPLYRLVRRIKAVAS